LTENRLFATHSRILALAVLRKNAKRRRDRSHPGRSANHSFSISFISQQLDKPDDSVAEYNTSGEVVNASLITGLTDEPVDIVVSGSNLFVGNVVF
jgi:hypothetical protein